MKTLGLAGTTLALGKTAMAAPKDKENIEFYGILYDSTRCVGCQTCENSCAEAHGLQPPTDMPEAGVIRKTDENRRTVVNLVKTSKGELYVKNQCMHCNEPACAAACLTQAMKKTKEGPVVWNSKKCMGCRYCMVSCPFDVPKFEYHSANPSIIKCDMCYDRIRDGKIPACAENCPAEAILFGTRRDLLREARKRIHEQPDVYADYIYGEKEAGGTAEMYLSQVPPAEMGFKTKLQNESYPALSKGFLYTVPSVFVLLPVLLLGIRETTKNHNQITQEEDENE